MSVTTRQTLMDWTTIADLSLVAVYVENGHATDRLTTYVSVRQGETFKPVIKERKVYVAAQTEEPVFEAGPDQVHRQIKLEAEGQSPGFNAIAVKYALVGRH